MLSQGSQGYGICGHKNTYSSYVRNGNWNEDRYGAELLCTRASPNVEDYRLTEHSRNYSNPREKPVDPKMSLVKMESIEAIKAKNKEGLSYSLIFQHGNKLQEPEDRFRTQAQLSSASFSKFSIPDGTRALTRERDMNREVEDTLNMTSTSRSADVRVNMSPPRSPSKRTVVVDPSPLPKWNRRKPRIK